MMWRTHVHFVRLFRLKVVWMRIVELSLILVENLKLEEVNALLEEIDIPEVL
jgi:hypothetical protein